ncbi:DUF2339 domain-containing protein [Sphingopyxis flava]|uniref:Uncharacterized membrane protein n=1 Tax=Sphingopyxis flava TaxID=1507287 RepID=A0A1T5BPQ3_9SPHN|nr:DUF2339 domain-containing protein [Sphingopyxis flava]SKB48843.1 Uncharacterized membrane protein [Sphingopyxis flava]
MELLAFLALIIFFVLLMDARSRLKRAEATLQEAAKRIGALQRHTGLLPPKAEEPPPPDTSLRTEPPEPVYPRAAVAGAPMPSVAKDVREEVPKTHSQGRPPAAPRPTPKSQIGSEAAPPRRIASRFEDLFGKTLPIWAGGVTLAIAGVLIVRYAMDAGFFARVFTPGVQIAAGLLFGLVLIGGAEYARRNDARLRDVRVPQALAGAGVATLYAAIMVAANIYLLIGPLLAFAALALVTAASLGLSLRFGPPSAALGLSGGLAAPALVGALAPDVPLIAVYLALTIAALAGVARIRRWPWLALAALIGGAAWGLWMVLTQRALDALGSLSIGGFVLLLAIAIPMLSFEGPRAALLRTASAIVGALQLALLVGYGGFAPLHWGLFVLIAASAQWLAWREAGFAIVPTISAALSLLLLAAWPDAAPFWFTLIGPALLAVHALPLLARLWGGPGMLRRALELCAIAIAMPALTKWQLWGIGDAALALVALGGAALAGVGMARGWRLEARLADRSFSFLTAAAGALLALAILLLLPRWMAPLAIGLVAGAMLFFGKTAGDRRIEPVATVFLGAAMLALLAAPLAFAELPRLVEGASGGAGQAFLRWAGVGAVAALFAVRGEGAIVRRLSQFTAALLAYGAFAQIASADWLMLVPALGGGAALLTARRVPLARVDTAALGFAALSLGWAVWPIGAWSSAALLSLAGQPMPINAARLPADGLVLRLFLPALAFGVPLWWVRGALPRWSLLAALCACIIVGGVAVHSLYRLGFAALAGGDFVATGIAQRLLWEALLIGGGWLARERGMLALARPLVIAGTLHAFVYGLLLHNPLWAGQAVGGWPLINLLALLFFMAGAGAVLAPRLFPSASASLERGVQIVLMLLVAGFAWATLRQIFHGSLLVEPGVAPAENILRSLLILALAIGFLLWGIRTARHDWRIASLLLMLGAVGKVFLFDVSGLEGLLRIGSFVALGFSLIGIGWLYSRQLAGASSPQRGNP